MGSAPRFRLKVINLNKAYRVDEGLVRRIVSCIFGQQKTPGMKELEIVFLTDRAIRTLNKRYMGEDRPTDVLSFELGAGSSDMIGDIFISIDKARTNSKVYNTAPEEELTLYIIHGILHLVGYDDLNKKERFRMEKRQGEILKILCKREDLSKVLTRR